MRPAASLLLTFALALACNGTAAPGGPRLQPDAAGEDEPEPPPPKAKDAGVGAEPEAAVAEKDAPQVTADAPVVVAPTGPGPDTTVTAFAGTPVYFLGMDNKRIVDV